MAIWIKQTQKRIFYLGAILTFIFFCIKATVWPEFSAIFCIIPAEISVLIVPIYTYFKIASECKKLDNCTSNILIFCSVNFSLFFYIFMISAALRFDDLISVSWNSIFIAAYYDIFIYFLLLFFMVPGFFQSDMKSEASIAVLWGFALLVFSIYLPGYLENEKEFSLWILLMPVLIVSNYSLFLGIAKMLFYKEQIGREMVFYLLCLVFIVLLTLEIWVAAYAIGMVFFTIDWVLDEIDYNDKYKSVD